MRTSIFVAIVLGLFITACANQQTNTTGTNITQTAGKTPDDTGGVGTPNAVPNTAGLQQCKQTIPYQTLIGALPKGAGAFNAQNPEGTALMWTDPTNSQNTVTYSTASTVLTSSNTSVIVSVLDTCYVQYLSAGWSSRAIFNGTQGFLQKTTIAGHPAWEQYDRESETYALNVLVKDRVLVTVQGTEGASEADIRTVATAIDYTKIADAAAT